VDVDDCRRSCDGRRVSADEMAADVSDFAAHSMHAEWQLKVAVFLSAMGSSASRIRVYTRPPETEQPYA